MIKLNLKKYEYAMDLKEPVHGFERPIVFYKYHKKDASRFFLTFSIVDFPKCKISHLFSYLPENLAIMTSTEGGSRYKMNFAPHCTIEINKNVDFLMFLQEENYFMYVNRENNTLIIYSMADIITEDITFKTISSTFFKDDTDNNYFYMSVLDINNLLYIYRISNDLKSVELIDSFPGKNNPPHTVKKYKDCVLLSHEFTEAQYYLKKQDKIITDREMGALLTKLQMKIEIKYNELDKYQKKKILSKYINEEYEVECMPSRIMLVDLLTKDKCTYSTNGSNSAHFEIDERANMLYVSSHNFFEGDSYIYMFQPAVLDKFEYVNNRLNWRGCFKYEKGYRYTSHRVFYLDGKAYLCTFGKPNRLLFIDPDNMQLLFYTDIGRDELTNVSDLGTYLNARHEDQTAGSEYIGIEVSHDGESVFFLDDQYLFIYNVRCRHISHKIRYEVNDVSDWSEYKLIAPHITNLQ